MADHVAGVGAPGRYDANVESESVARGIILAAFPDAIEIAPAVSGQPYPNPPPGTKKWFQFHPAEPNIGHELPHIKYVDWTRGKKGSGGSWGHLFFPPMAQEVTIEAWEELSCPP